MLSTRIFLPTPPRRFLSARLRVRRIWAWLLPLSLLILVGCRHSQGSGPPVTLGAIYNLTGDQKYWDVPAARGARLAIAGANSSGGVRRRRVRLIVEDGQSDPAVVAARTERILREHPDMLGLMGLSDAEMVVAAATVAARQHRVFLTSGATSPLLPAQVPECLFLACSADNVQAAAAAEWARLDRAVGTASVFFDATAESTRLLAQYFQERFRELGGQVKSVVGYTPSNLAAAIGQLTRAEVVFLAVRPAQVVEAVERLRRSGVAPAIIGSDALDLGKVWREHPDWSEIFFTTHVYLGADNPDARVQAFRKAYRQAYPGSDPDAFAALGYDAANLLMQAVEQPLRADPATVLETLAQIQEIDGVTGTITFELGSRIPRKAVSLVRVEGGRTRLEKRILPERVSHAVQR